MPVSTTPIVPLAYSPADAARALSIGRTYLYSLIRDGKLETRKLGSRTLIPASSLQRLLDEAEAA